MVNLAFQTARVLDHTRKQLLRGVSVSRITELEPQDDAEIVNRIVAQVHRVLDKHFPETRSPSTKRFAKTEFSVYSEDTVVERKLPAEVTDTGNADSGDHHLPPDAEVNQDTTSYSQFSRMDELSVTGNRGFALRSENKNKRATRLFVWLLLLFVLIALAATYVMYPDLPAGLLPL